MKPHHGANVRRWHSGGSSRDSDPISSWTNASAIRLRAGEKGTAAVTVEPQPAEEGTSPKGEADTTDGSAGLTLAPLDDAMRKKLEAPPSVRGVVVVSVRPGSPAAEAGLEAGDVVVEVGRKAVSRPDEVARHWRDAKGPLALLVWRKGHTFFAVLKR
jgi:S1-C subfamily serine protease